MTSETADTPARLTDGPTDHALRDKPALLRTLDDLACRIEDQLQALYPPTPEGDHLTDLTSSAPSWDALAPAQQQQTRSRLHDALTTPVRHLIEAGGQRWRHGLMLVAIEVLGGDSEHFAPLAASVEAMHTGSLMVDDVEDDAVLRRGRPSAHHVYGTSVALNAGTAAYFAFDTAIRTTAAHDPVLRAGLYETYLAALRAAHAGQGLDVRGHREEMERTLGGGCPQELLACVRLAHQLKSGAVVGASLRMAGQVVAAGETTCAALFAFGSAVGTAYQITDDVADLRGAQRGGRATKRVGEDLHNGKVTMPLAHAVRLLPADEAARMWGRVRDATADEETVAAIRARLEGCGALDACMADAEDLLASTWRDLEPLLPRSPRTELMWEMARHVVSSHRIA
ncbi:polyprenyl synthetase family protein [Streptomyces sp. NPDC096048]|uniref:polyprenyl synthetase family protein n=1 Tax=Streptomyces sp. NPDC096048 TaxID=3366072 RepID=UPI003825DE73